MPNAKQLLTAAALVSSIVGHASAQTQVAPESIEELDVITAGDGVDFSKTMCGTVCPEPPSIREAARAADAIFVGLVESLTVETRPLDLGPGAIKIDQEITVIDFSVRELLKGADSDELTVRTYYNDLCALDLTVGQLQLVYASLLDEQLWIHLGTRSKPADVADAEVATLRKRLKHWTQ